jgi:hypothetical protein
MLKIKFVVNFCIEMTRIFFENWNILSQMPYWEKKNTSFLLKLYWNQNNNYRMSETCRKQSPETQALCETKEPSLQIQTIQMKSNCCIVFAHFMVLLRIACSFLVFLCEIRFMSWIHTLIPLISMSKHNLKTSTPIEVHFGEKTHLQHAFH